MSEWTEAEYAAMYQGMAETDREMQAHARTANQLAAALARVARLEEAARKVKQMIDADPDISVGKARMIGRLIDAALEAQP